MTISAPITGVTFATPTMGDVRVEFTNSLLVTANPMALFRPASAELAV